jgi:hypothetical protein
MENIMSYKVGDRVAYVAHAGGEDYINEYRDKDGNPGVAEVSGIYANGLIYAVMVSGLKAGTEVWFTESEIAPSMKIVNVKRGLSGFAVKLFGKILGESGKTYGFGYIRSATFRGWVCSCNDFVYRRAVKNQNCKHLHFVRTELKYYCIPSGLW